MVPVIAMGVLGYGVCGETMYALEIEDVLTFGSGRFAVQPQLDLGGFYADNIFYGSGTNRIGDFGALISPGIRLQYGYDGDNQIILDYAHDEFFYVDNTQANTSQDRFDLALRYERGKTLLNGTSSIQFLSGFLGGAINSLGMLVDQTRMRNEYRVTWDRSAKTDLYIDGLHFSRDFKQQIGVLDVQDLTGSVGGSYKYSDRLRFFTEGFFGYSEVSSNQPGGADGPNSTVYGGFLGARGNFTGKLSGSVKVGYETRTFESGRAISSSTPAVAMDVSYAAGPFTTLTLGYERRTSVGPQFVQQTMVGDVITLRLNQFIGGTGRWMIQANGRYTTYDLSDVLRTVAGIGDVNLGRTDNTFSAGLALMFAPRDWAKVSLAYDYERFNTDYRDPNADRVFRIIGYDANRITLTMSFGY